MTTYHHSPPKEGGRPRSQNLPHNTSIIHPERSSSQCRRHRRSLCKGVAWQSCNLWPAMAERAGSVPVTHTAVTSPTPALTKVDMAGLPLHSSLPWWHNRFFALSTPLVMLKRSEPFKTTMAKRTRVHSTVFTSWVPPFTTCIRTTKVSHT